MELDALITDLALILIVAGVVTLLFKKLKQPVVLGYIVAGFLVGPNFVFFPTIVDEGDINLWAELGIIVLLFSLGLEFSFKKLFQVGASAVLTALVIVLGMMLAGYGAGRLLHFTYLDSIFLGAMLSMSSTTIIIKAFTDLNFTALCHSCKCGIISRSGNMTFQCGFPVESLIRQKLTYIYICQRDIHIQRIADNTAINQSRPIINIG